MHFVLWDTRSGGATKDFAGGFGTGEYPAEAGFYGRLIRWAMNRDRRPVALAFAYLAAILRRQGHTVEYALDRFPKADVYYFHPSLPSLPWERQSIARVRRELPGCQVLVGGIVAHTLPESFEGLDCLLVRGEIEQLHWALGDVLSSSGPVIELGRVDDLDALPWPDWSLFSPQSFRVSYDFSRFPTGLVQQSRGCTLSCNYCPYIVLEKKVRHRQPELVVAEMAAGIRRFGFRSFKFRDPLFGLDRARALELAERIRHLPTKIQFSIESRIDLLREETLRALRAAGLTSITFGIETPDRETLRRHNRVPIADYAQRRFVALCRELGIRTVAGFMIGFPDDTPERIDAVLRYAQALNPTFANFNVVTPYPGTEFFEEVKPRIADFDYSRYGVYTPVVKCTHLTAGELSALRARAFTKFYFRSRWLSENARLLWPGLPWPAHAAASDANPTRKRGRHDDFPSLARRVSMGRSHHDVQSDLEQQPADECDPGDRGERESHDSDHAGRPLAA